MNKQKLIERVAELMARFRTEVETLNSINLYDINIHAENILIPLLNNIYGLNLVNANFEDKNTSAIDLIDKENRIAIQVTSTASSEKIKHTIEQYVKYKKNEEFDQLFIYIITTKQKKYTSESFEKLINNQFEFSCDNNILDYTDIVKEINSWISLPKIQTFLDILESEFSEEKIQNRRFIVENRDKIISETIYPNILEVFLPEKIYMGRLGINRDEIITKSWETPYRLKKRAPEGSVVRKAFDFLNVPFSRDWHVFENKLISFKPLDDKSEPLSLLVETGSVEEFLVEEFAHINFKYENALLQLIDSTIQELLSYKDIQWVNKERLYRFRPPKLIGKREITWKNKKAATRTVVKEAWNSEKTQINCFQQLSFKMQSFSSESKWYIAITPTWSYTYDGYRNHISESTFITQKKKLENNNAVYQHFMFIHFCLSNKILESEKDYSLLSFSEPFNLQLNYKAEYGY